MFYAKFSRIILTMDCVEDVRRDSEMAIMSGLWFNSLSRGESSSKRKGSDKKFKCKKGII